MFLQCRFCKYFKHTGENEIGTPYELGGECLYEEQKTCSVERYCNGGADACTNFECGMESAQKIIAEGNGVTLAIRDEYKKLHDKYRALCEEEKVPDTIKVKADMLDMILKAKTSGMDSYGIMNMLNMAEYGLKWVKDNG